MIQDSLIHSVVRRLRFVIVAGLALLAGAAQASVIYRFDSGNYTNVVAPYTAAMHLMFQFTLPTALAPSTTTTSVYTLPGFAGFSWNDGLATYAPSGFQTLDLTTNANGGVTSWDFSFFNNAASAAGNNIGDSGFTQAVTFANRLGAFRGDGTGSFSVTVINATPEPDTVALIGLAIVGLAVGRRLQRRGFASLRR